MRAQDNFIDSGWRVDVPATEAEIRSKFGTPVTLTRTPVENRHVQGQKDELVDIGYAGFEIRLYKTPKIQIPYYVSISSPDIRVALGLHVSSSVDSVILTLGNPAERKDGILRYTNHDGYEQDVSFTAVEGIVRKIEWHLAYD